MPQPVPCCADLVEAIEGVPNSLFHIGDNGALYLSVGYVRTDEGTGFFDQAVKFCPFCGVRVHEPDS